MKKIFNIVSIICFSLLLPLMLVSCNISPNNPKSVDFYKENGYHEINIGDNILAEYDINSSIQIDGTLLLRHDAEITFSIKSLENKFDYDNAKLIYGIKVNNFTYSSISKTLNATFNMNVSVAYSNFETIAVAVVGIYNDLENPDAPTIENLNIRLNDDSLTVPTTAYFVRLDKFNDGNFGVNFTNVAQSKLNVLNENNSYQIDAIIECPADFDEIYFFLILKDETNKLYAHVLNKFISNSATVSVPIKSSTNNISSFKFTLTDDITTIDSYE
ncbi:MAG: hypothetical protein IJ538_01105 [Clostridia bacterium]|nr:hypothetical protein [Clostridia bacterium]